MSYINKRLFGVPDNFKRTKGTNNSKIYIDPWSQNNLGKEQSWRASHFMISNYSIKLQKWRMWYWHKDINTDIFLKKTHTHIWPTDTWKDAQHHQSSGKCKPKPQWHSSLHLPGWLLENRQEITSIGEDEDRQKSLCTTGGNIINRYSLCK